MISARTAKPCSTPLYTKSAQGRYAKRQKTETMGNGPNPGGDTHIKVDLVRLLGLFQDFLGLVTFLSGEDLVSFCVLLISIALIGQNNSFVKGYY